MPGKGNPYDNTFVEGFMKTLKAEEVDCNEYAKLGEAQAEIGTFIERIYNRKRLHSATDTGKGRSLFEPGDSELCLVWSEDLLFPPDPFERDAWSAVTIIWYGCCDFRVQGG